MSVLNYSDGCPRKPYIETQMYIGLIRHNTSRENTRCMDIGYMNRSLLCRNVLDSSYVFSTFPMWLLHRICNFGRLVYAASWPNSRPKDTFRIKTEALSYGGGSVEALSVF